MAFQQVSDVTKAVDELRTNLERNLGKYREEFKSAVHDAAADVREAYPNARRAIRMFDEMLDYIERKTRYVEECNQTLSEMIEGLEANQGWTAQEIRPFVRDPAADIRMKVHDDACDVRSHVREQSSEIRQVMRDEPPADEADQPGDPVVPRDERRHDADLIRQRVRDAADKYRSGSVQCATRFRANLREVADKARAMIRGH